MHTLNPELSQRGPLWPLFGSRLTLLLILLVLSGPLLAASSPSAVKLAVLKYGTVNWELMTMQRQKLDRRNGFELQVLPMAGMSATRTALKSGAADVIVADWMWVSRQRDMGDKLQFIPYSSSIGKIMLAQGSDIQTLADLKGKKIGIAGGPVSKGWLLLRGLAMKQGIDLKVETEQQYGAPPLLNAALERGRLDAVITFWHYAARLEGKGYPVFYDLKEVSRQLGMESELPMLGYVFHQDWAKQNPGLVAALQQASGQTKDYLRDNEKAWLALKPAMKAKSEAVFQQLKTGFLAGVPSPVVDGQLQDAERMFALLAQLGGKKLVGDSQNLDPETFWQPQP